MLRVLRCHPPGGSLCCQGPMSCKQQPDPKRQKPRSHAEPRHGSMQASKQAICCWAPAGVCNIQLQRTLSLQTTTANNHRCCPRVETHSCCSMVPARASLGAVPTCQQKSNSGKSFSGARPTGCHALLYTKMNRAMRGGASCTQRVCSCLCAWPAVSCMHATSQAHTTAPSQGRLAVCCKDAAASTGPL